MNVDPVIHGVVNSAPLKLWMVYSEEGLADYDCFTSGVVLAETAQKAIQIVYDTKSLLIVPDEEDPTVYHTYVQHRDLEAIEIDMSSPKMIHVHVHYG